MVDEFDRESDELKMDYVEDFGYLPEKPVNKSYSKKELKKMKKLKEKQDKEKIFDGKFVNESLFSPQSPEPSKEKKYTLTIDTGVVSKGKK